MAKRGRPRKNPEWETGPIEVGHFTIREVDGKFLIYLHGNVRAIRHTEQEAREYIAMVS